MFALYDLCYMWLYNDILLDHSMLFCMKRSGKKDEREKNIQRTESKPAVQSGACSEN